jgi:hypothetical protein
MFNTTAPTIRQRGWQSVGFTMSSRLAQGVRNDWKREKGRTKRAGNNIKNQRAELDIREPVFFYLRTVWSASNPE